MDGPCDCSEQRHPHPGPSQATGRLSPVVTGKGKTRIPSIAGCDDPILSESPIRYRIPARCCRVVAELRLAGISRDAIAACAPDLEPVTEAYEAELKEAGLTDWPGVLALASTGYASLTSRNCEGFYHPGNRVGLPGPDGGAERIRTTMLLVTPSSKRPPRACHSRAGLG
jgi:hypothetical protein